MPDWNSDDALRIRVEGRLPLLYVLVAGVITTLLALMTAPFFAPDEPNQACRAITLSHGALLATLGRTEEGGEEAGGPIDADVYRVMDGMNDIRMTWERRGKDFHDRPYGAVPEALQRRLTEVRWARRTVFVPFGNTAVYPPVLYLPAMAAWRVGEALDLTVFWSLRLARLGCGGTAIALGWVALRVCAGAARWLLLGFLLLPSTLFLNAGCSQDAMLLAVAALLAAVMTRPLAAGRDFTAGELTSAAMLLAVSGTARPPYLALGLVLFLPRLEVRGAGRRWVGPAVAWLSVLGAGGWWRSLVRPLGLDWADQAEPRVQEVFLRIHPLAAAAAVMRGTAEAAGDFFQRGLYVIGWNDLLAAGWLRIAVAVCLAGIVVGAPAGRGLSRRGCWWLGICIAGPLLGVSVAEYIIWTPPGYGTVFGIQPRYWLPLMPLTGLLGGELVRRCLAVGEGRWRAWMLIAAAAGLAGIACTLPWVAAHAFYGEEFTRVLRLNLR